MKGDVAGLGLAFRFWDIVELVNEEPPLGGNLEGTVPARARRVGLNILLSEGGMKSGNPSWLGDSGIVSLNGVEPPLAGGPHTGVNPS